MSSVAVVILSCDSHLDAARPLATLLRRYWKECAWPKYLVTNERYVEVGDLACVTTGPDLSWSRQVSRALTLGGIQERTLLVLVGDYFSLRAWNDAALRSLADLMDRVPNLCYARLVPTPIPLGPARPEMDGLLAEHVYGDASRCSLMPAFWHRSYLMSLVQRGYPTPWRFENECQGEPTALHLCVRDPARTPVHFTGAIRFPKSWQAEALAHCLKEGVPCPDPI